MAHYKPDSVFADQLYTDQQTMAIYLDSELLPSSSPSINWILFQMHQGTLADLPSPVLIYTLLYRSKLERDTSLHPRKDLAVSPPLLPQGLISHILCKMPRTLSSLDVTVRTSRITPDGRYPLRVSFLLRVLALRSFNEGVSGLSSLW